MHFILRGRVIRSHDFDTPMGMSKAPTWPERQKALHAVLQKHDLADPHLRRGVVQLFNRETDDPQWEEEAEARRSDLPAAGCLAGARIFGL